jgi:hypothetical protein
VRIATNLDQVVGQELSNTNVQNRESSSHDVDYVSLCDMAIDDGVVQRICKFLNEKASAAQLRIMIQMSHSEPYLNLFVTNMIRAKSLGQSPELAEDVTVRTPSVDANGRLT